MGRGFLATRKVIKKHLPKGYAESFRWGMLAGEIPLSRFPDACNTQPLMCQASGKKLDVGKGCLHFKMLEDLSVELIGEMVAWTPVDRRIVLSGKGRSGSRLTISRANGRATSTDGRVRPVPRAAKCRV